MTHSEALSAEIQQRIETKIPNAKVQVINGSDKHYALIVISEIFKGMSQVKQHQLVYSAITDLMTGNDAPIHAIDKMDLRAE